MTRVIARHRSDALDPRERGLAFGRDMSTAVRGTVAAYERLFGEMHGLDGEDLGRIGSRVRRRLEADAPRALAEIAGIAAGAGVGEEVLLAVNARTEIFAGQGPPECSVIAVGGGRSSEGPMLAQNWDWHPDAGDSLVLWSIPRRDGGWMITLTEAGILAKIGLNSDGVAVAINLLGSSADGGVDGMPIHLALRRLLESSRTLAEADELLRRETYSASTAVTIVDGDRDELRTFEVSPNGVGAIAPTAGLCLHTNHFLTPPGNATDAFLDSWPDTTARLADLEQRFAGASRVDSAFVKDALRSHDAGSIAVCCHDPDNPTYADRQETLASVLMHPTDRRIELSAGPPCTAPYDAVRDATLAAT